MRSTVRVEGIEAEGRHGANAGERDRPQPFLVDVEVVVDVREDSLDATIDYGVIASTVRDVVGATSFVLLETLAHEVARGVYGLPHVEFVTAVVHKPRAAEIVGADDVAAEATIAQVGVTAFLGLGSNVGDRLENLTRAVRHLGRVSGIRVVRSSRVYETDPVGGPEQPDFLNAVVEIDTMLTPRDLLNSCLDVEDTLGRQRGVRWGPRSIDVDVLTYGDLEVDEEGLEVPHPRMHERAFVLVPLLELAADPPLPRGRRIATLRLGPEVLGGVRPFAPPLPT